MSLRIMLYSSTSRLKTGGVQAVYARLAAGLRLRRHTVFEAWSKPGPASRPGEVVFRLPHLYRRWGIISPGAVLRAGGALLGLAVGIAKCRPHIINVHFLRSECLYFLLLRPIFRFRLVLTAHGSDVLVPLPPDDVLLPRLLSRADAITAVSSAVAAKVLTYPRLAPHKVHIIPNGIDYDFWSAPRCRLESTEQRQTVLAVGRLAPVKGFDVLLKAFAYVHARCPRTKLKLIGEGECRDQLVTMARDLGLGDAVVFSGHLAAEDIRNCMWQSSVFALSSRSEGMPLALLEAMAAGLPCVATSVGGVPDVIQNTSGILVPTEDPTALAEALLALLTDPDYASALGDNAARRAREFSADAVDSAYETLFRQLLGSQPVS